MKRSFHAIILSVFASASLCMAAGEGGTVPVPDFTNGDAIPKGYTHERS